MEATEDEVTPSYHGRIESKIDAILLFEHCFTSRGPFPNELPVQSGHVFILRNFDVNKWRDGKDWTRIDEDDIGFQHFELSSETTLRKKTWIDYYRQQRFRLVAYYSQNEQSKQRPSQDRLLLASIYKEQSFWFDAFETRLKINQLLEDMNSCSINLIHERGVDENRSRFFQLTSSLVETLEKLGGEVSLHVRSGKDGSKGNAIWDEKALNLMEYNRCTIWQDYGLAQEIVSIGGEKCFNEFDYLTAQLLERCEHHTLKMMGCLERKEVGEDDKMLT